jgi:hypothetical protein
MEELAPTKTKEETSKVQPSEKKWRYTLKERAMWQVGAGQQLQDKQLRKQVYGNNWKQHQRNVVFRAVCAKML